MEQTKARAKITELVEKISKLNSSVFNDEDAKISPIEIDLMLQHLRELYDCVLSLNHQPAEGKREKQESKSEERKTEVKEVKRQPEIKIPQAEMQEAKPDTPSPKVADKKEVREEIVKTVEKKEEPVKKTSASVKAEMVNRTPPKQSLNEKFKKETAGIGEKLGLQPVSDLKTAIGVNQRFRFINELFGRNFSDYDSAVRQINDCKGSEEATPIVNQLKSKYKWDDKNPTVKDFMELVKRRFLS